MKSLAKQIGDRQRGDKPPMKCRSLSINALALTGGKWTPHDLRRTGATMMGILGIRPDVIEKCLNHVEQNRLVRISQRQKLKAEQRAAWTLLGERLKSLIGAPIAEDISPDRISLDASLVGPTETRGRSFAAKNNGVEFKVVLSSLHKYND